MARLLWILLLLPTAALAATNQAQQTIVYPCRPAAGSITIDGRLDPAEWAGAVEVSGFQVSGSDKLAAEQVTMRLLYDGRNLYLGVKCLESNMKGLVATVVGRDGAFWTDDAIEFFLDPKHDHETFWQFATTPKASLYDSSQGDSLWNSEWKAATQRAEDSWTVEAAVPFADLRLPAPQPGALWGFNLCREREAGGKLELFDWADVQRVFNTVSRFGHLRFVGADWQPDAPTVAAAAREVGGKETLVFVPDGYWRVAAGGKPEHLPFRSLLRGTDADVGPRMAEMRAAFEKNPNLAHKAEFNRLDTEYARVKSLVAGDAPVDAVTWAGAQSFLDNLQEKSEVVYWRVRLAQLNETL